MNQIIKTIKEVHNEDICFFKIGNFYHVYGRDASIIAYAFGYKIKEKGNQKECGFPEMALSKVCAKVENLKINYLIIDNRNEYDVEVKEDYKEKNNYSKYYEKANRYVNCQKRINGITEFLNENIEQNDIIKIIGKMEEIMYERGKI